MYAAPVLLYATLCLLVAWRGRQTTLGYLGSFLLSIFLTPVLVFIVLLLLTPPPARKARLLREDRERLPLR